MTEHRSSRGNFIFGASLLAIGVLLLLDNLDFIDLGPIWMYWPLLLVISGISKMAGESGIRWSQNGLFSVFLGLWILACEFHIWGLRWSSAWPILLIGLGLSLIASHPSGRSAFVAKVRTSNGD
ncbi:MAG TPA: DUF5668 domain-containing protein [Bacteroidota bacterium]|nr:DUF5668 domain-containing protein [Bacteroidota bacterium]